MTERVSPGMCLRFEDVGELVVLRIAIIETGAPPAGLDRRHGDYPAMMERMLAPYLPHARFFAIPLHKGAPPPALDAFDALLLTGSPAGVYEDHDWIAPLEDLVRAAAEEGRPQVGVCFGHQLMAQAFGGRVEKSGKGWGVGVHRYDVVAPAPWMQPSASRIACAVSHQDQVLEAPAGAIRLAGSDFCPNGALAYAEGPAISFQMHPEFDHAFAAELLRARRERIAAPLVETGLASLAGASDRALIAQWIAAFYQSP